jgi:hypothetical protein
MTKTIADGVPGKMAPHKRQAPKVRISKGLRLVVWAAAATSLGLLTWMRLPPVAQQTVWAEDGGIFLRDVLGYGHVQSIFLPYDGYLHVIPRTVVSIAHAFAPIQDYALAVSFLTCLAVAIIGMAAFHLSRSIVESIPVRLMIAGIPVLLPVGPQEVLGNAANLHWYLLWLLPWLLLYQPKSRTAATVSFMAILTVATSEMISVIFLPLALWAALRRRTFAGPAGLVLGLSLQFAATLASPRIGDDVNHHPVDAMSVLLGFGLLPIGSSWQADSKVLATHIIAHGAWALFVPCFLVLLLLVYTLAVGTSPLKAAALGAVGAASACWVASVVVSSKIMFNYANYSEADWATGFGYMRYAAAPAMFLLLLLPLAVAAAQANNQLNRQAPFAVAGMFFAFLLVSFFPTFTARHSGPAWAAGVADARADCEADATVTAAIVPIAPAGWKFSQVEFSCQDLKVP